MTTFSIADIQANLITESLVKRTGKWRKLKLDAPDIEDQLKQIEDQIQQEKEQAKIDLLNNQVKELIDSQYTEDEFDIFIVTDVSFVSSERMLAGDRFSEQGSRAAMIISERVRFGDKGQERINYQQACALKPDFGWALFNCVQEYLTEVKELEAKKKKSQKS
jgi:hypothetical protein